MPNAATPGNHRDGRSSYYLKFAQKGVERVFLPRGCSIRRQLEWDVSCPSSSNLAGWNTNCLLIRLQSFQSEPSRCLTLKAGFIIDGS